MAALSPTAHRILEATRRLLARNGFAGLSFEAIAAEAGENKASIRYHFGNKAGLMTALVDSVVHDSNVALVQSLQKLPKGERRVNKQMDAHAAMVCDTDAYQLFFDLAPHVLRDDTLAPRLADLYRWYRDLDVWSFDPDADETEHQRLVPLAALTVAVSDGMALQVLADREFDPRPAYRLLEEFVRAYLQQSNSETD